MLKAVFGTEGKVMARERVTTYRSQSAVLEHGGKGLEGGKCRGSCSLSELVTQVTDADIFTA